ncbi:MAG: hypothetical protein M3680_10935 [Myxococcota bacterium]|nr:hypothetical protein [Myxococcota bacterium]
MGSAEVAGLAVAAAGAWLWWRGRRRYAIRTTPDRPQSFGYKSTWIAVEAATTNEVVIAICASHPGARRVASSNWESGLHRTLGRFRSREVFATPPVHGWVLVVGYHGAGEDLASLRELQELSATLDREVLYFGSHRGVSYVHWVIADRGTLRRAYAHVDGTTFYDVGTPPPHEAVLDLVGSLPERGADDRDPEPDEGELRLPDESTVVHLAGAWSVDPTKLDAIEEVSVGVLVRMPRSRRP